VNDARYDMLDMSACTVDGCRWRGGEVESKGWLVCACAQQEGECLHVTAA
jgi:hypothetical protein